MVKSLLIGLVAMLVLVTGATAAESKKSQTRNVDRLCVWVEQGGTPDTAWDLKAVKAYTAVRKVCIVGKRGKPGKNGKAGRAVRGAAGAVGPVGATGSQGVTGAPVLRRSGHRWPRQWAARDRAQGQHRCYRASRASMASMASTARTASMVRTVSTATTGPSARLARSERPVLLGHRRRPVLGQRCYRGAGGPAGPAGPTGLHWRDWCCRALLVSDGEDGDTGPAGPAWHRWTCWPCWAAGACRRQRFSGLITVAAERTSGEKQFTVSCPLNVTPDRPTAQAIAAGSTSRVR